THQAGRTLLHGSEVGLMYGSRVYICPRGCCVLYKLHFLCRCVQQWYCFVTKATAAVENKHLINNSTRAKQSEEQEKNAVASFPTFACCRLLSVAWSTLVMRLPRREATAVLPHGIPLSLACTAWSPTFAFQRLHDILLLCAFRKALTSVAKMLALEASSVAGPLYMTRSFDLTSRTESSACQKRGSNCSIAGRPPKSPSTTTRSNSFLYISSTEMIPPACTVRKAATAGVTPSAYSITGIVHEARCLS
ncbi:unnamed protein product, partial [Ectocarpus sp. 6 AP-2014]